MIVQYSPFEQVSGSVPVDTVVVSGAGFADWVSRTSTATVVEGSALAANGNGALLQVQVPGAKQWSYLSGLPSAIPSTAWAFEGDMLLPTSAEDVSFEAVAIGVGRANDPNISNPQIFVQYLPKAHSLGVWTQTGFGAFSSAAVTLPLGRYFHWVFQYEPNYPTSGSNRFEVFVSGEKIISEVTAAFGFAAGTDSIQLTHSITPGIGVLWDNIKFTFGLQYGETVAQDVDSAEFDWESSSVQVSQVIPLTEFVNDIYAFRCRIMNIPACVRRVRATNACRRMDVAPEVLH